MVFDDDGVFRQFHHFAVVQRVAVAHFHGHVDGFHGTAGFRFVREFHLQQFGADIAADHRRLAFFQHRLMYIEFVGIDGALHHGLAQAIAGGDEDHVLEARFRVDGEHHAGGAQVGTHHALHAGRQGHFSMRKALVHAIRDGAVVVQRGEHLFHGFEHVVDAHHVQEGFLLASKRGVRQVFRRRRGTHGKRHFRIGVGHQLGVELVDFGGQAWLERGFDDPLTDLGTGLRQRAHVVDVQAFEALGDAFGQRQAAIGAIRQEVAESLRRGGEATRHAHAGFRQLADHFAQGGVLAADGFDIRHAQMLERGDVHRVLVFLLRYCVGHNDTLTDDRNLYARRTDSLLVILGVVQHNHTVTAILPCAAQIDDAQS